MLLARYLILSMLIVAACAAGMLGCQTTPEPEPSIVVPDVVGLSVEAAEENIEEAALTPRRTGHDYSAEFPPGDIIEQQPAGGTEAEEGDEVHLTLSRGTAPVAAPDVIGLSQNDAESTIAEAGLTVGDVEGAYSDEAPEGEVLRQEPEAGTELSVGSAVALTVSDGRHYVTVPDVVGTAQSDAPSLLEEVGLAMGDVARRASHDTPAGTVMTQDPEAGAEHPYGEAVEVVVSAGPPQATVPDLIGQPNYQAEAAIEEAGLTVGTVTREPSGDIDIDHVLAQSPQPGAQQTVGSQVDFVVSTGALRVSVPDVRGMDQSAAVSAMRNAGLNVETVTEVSDDAPAGEVVRHDPPGNIGVEAGTGIRLFVSSGS